MTVRDLKELLRGVPNHTKVLIPASTFFDGLFLSPCLEETGMAEIELEGEEDPTQCFLIAPHNYFSLEDDEEMNPSLN